MKRWIISISVLLLFFNLVLFGVGIWVLRSTAGAIWLLEAVANATELQITSGRIEGRLADELMVDDLLISWPNGGLSMQRVHLDWDPFSIVNAQLKIHLLEVDQLVIHDTDSVGSSDTPTIDTYAPEFSVSDLTFLPDWLTVEIAHLQLRGFTYKDEESTAVIADEISGSYLWTQQRINASEFSYLSPYVNLQGVFDWDLQSSPRLEMTADVHLPDVLVDPQLFEDIAVPVKFPGQLTLDGDWNDFSGPVRFGVVTEAGDGVWLAADARGSWQGIRFDNLKGRYLNGSLSGDLDLAWIDSYRMDGQLSVDGLKPAALVEDLDGLASLDVEGELLISYDDQPLQASLSATIHEARLRGHDIAGQLAADWQDGGLNELNLDLSGKGVRVVAKGKPNERLDLDIDIADLRQFHPDLAGQLLASGWLRWADDYLTGELDGSGTDLVWQEASLATLNLQGRHLEQQAPLELELSGQDLRYADQQVDHLQVGLSGTLERHDIQVTLDGRAVYLAAQLIGHYQEESWQAELQTLSAQTPTLGVWALEGPARIAWQPETLSIEHFSLSSQRGERVTLNVSDWGSSARAQVALTWHDLRHDGLAYLKFPQSFSGRSTGELQLGLVAQKPASLEVRMTASAELQDDLMAVTIPSLTAEAIWLEDGLALDILAESAAGERFEARAHSSQPPAWNWPPVELSLDVSWQGVDLERFSRLRNELDVQGLSEGRVQLEILAGKLLHVRAKIAANGLMQYKEQPVGFRSLLADVNWDNESFLFDVQAEGAHDGTLALHLTSTIDPRFSWPNSGQIELKVNNTDLQSLSPLLPEEINLDGIVYAESRGRWQDGDQIILGGQAGLSDSELIWQNDEGLVDAKLQQVDVEWQWQGDHLAGSIVAQLAEDGILRSNWQLPLPAHWPVKFVEDGALQADLHGQVRAAGLLVALAPGQIQDLQGQIESDLQLTGSWQNPVFSGRLTLTEASAYLPATGVKIEDLLLHVSLQNEQIRINEFSFRSGPGTLTGSGQLDFDQWQLENYHLVFKGDRVQVYNFPELQVLCSSELTLSGNSKKMKLYGNLLIPEMSLLGMTTASEDLPSNDVVVIEETHDDRVVLPIDADIRVDVKLGDQVWIKTSGVEARLEGGGMVTLDEQQRFAAQGEVRLIEGTYKAYGANLQIKQGVLSYKGGAIDNPALRVFAARDVGAVQAGVQITGSAKAPVVSLYSRPAMPERDILGYIFMGRPMRAGQEGEDALMIGTGALMPRYGETFSDLGISEIDIQGLFDDTGGVRLRKRLTEKWELASTLGSESGVDLYYVIKFD